MSSGVFFQNLPTEDEIKKFTHPTFWQEVFEYIFYFLKIFFSVAAIYIFIRTSIFDLLGVSGKSMYPNFDDKDALYIDQITPKFSDYRRGDVVVLLSPTKADGSRDLYIKRIIGLPGEKIVFDKGQVFVYNSDFPKGIVLDEKDYLNPAVKTYKQVITGSDRYEENVLRKDEYFVMGDNRTASTDSRIFGKISKSDIIGKEFYRIIPTTKAGFSAVPKYNITN